MRLARFFCMFLSTVATEAVCVFCAGVGFRGRINKIKALPLCRFSLLVSLKVASRGVMCSTQHVITRHVEHWTETKGGRVSVVVFFFRKGMDVANATPSIVTHCGWK